MSLAEDIVRARLREAIEEAVPEDPEQRRRFTEWFMRQLFAAAPDKAAFLDHMEAAIEHALEVEARERGLQ
jgi:uncharacterized protein with von Willebrand factor type A (vWA) domain